MPSSAQQSVNEKKKLPTNTLCHQLPVITGDCLSDNDSPVAVVNTDSLKYRQTVAELDSVALFLIGSYGHLPKMEHVHTK